MLQEFQSDNLTDGDGNPAGGWVGGIGIELSWQNGPLGRGEDRVEPNGVFVETVIAAAKQRLEFYQDSKFACDDNAMAINHLQSALDILANRTKNREERGVEGTHEI